MLTPFHKTFDDLSSKLYKYFREEYLKFIAASDEEDYSFLRDALFYLALGFPIWGDTLKADFYFRQSNDYTEQLGIGESESSHIDRIVYLNYVLFIQGKASDYIHLCELILRKSNALDADGISTTESYIFLAASYIQSEIDSSICYSKGLAKESDIRKLVYTYFENLVLILLLVRRR